MILVQFLCPGQEEVYNEFFNKISSGQNAYNVPFRFFAKNGDTKYIMVDSNVNFNEDGSFRHTRCFLHDDHERRVREATLEMERRYALQVSRAKDKFIRRTFHEIRTPLHVVLGILSSLPEEPLALSDVKEVCRHLGKGVYL